MNIATELKYENEDHTLGQMLQHYLRDQPFIAMRVPHPAQSTVQLKMVTHALMTDEDSSHAGILETLRAAHASAVQEGRLMTEAFETAAQAMRQCDDSGGTSASIRRRVTRSQARQGDAALRNEATCA